MDQQNKKEPSIFLKIQSKHRQGISSKFRKSFRGAGDLMVFYDFQNYGFKKNHQAQPSHQQP